MADKNQNKGTGKEEISYLGDDLDEDKENRETDQKPSAKKQITIGRTKLVLVKKLLENIKENNERLLALLGGLAGDEDEARINIGQLGEDEFRAEGEEDETADPDAKIIEGVFDGENMIGPDGKQYNVPANYASKSKLVEGDILKLTITGSGTFIYKQIGPIDRLRKVGVLEKDSEGRFFVNAENKKWRVLPASVTYFKGRVGDETVILIPRTGESKWAAVENIVRNNE